MADVKESLLRPGVALLRFANARDFVQALHPLSGLWGADPDWIFRGHANADYELLPSAHRVEAWTPLTTPLAKTFQPARADDMARAKRERGLLREFFRSADEAGLPLPEFKRTAELLSESARPEPSPDGLTAYWPHTDLIPILALAQHYGVPTRLLDWTRRGRHAGYFAALPPRKPASELAVWALDSGLLRDHGRLFPGVATCQLATAPRASNPNLHAQAGLFTYCQWYEDPKLRPLDEVITIGVEVLHRMSRSKGALPIVLKKMTLPRALAPDLLRLLHIDGVSGLTMYPGLGGVARHVQELAWCGLSTLGTPRSGRSASRK